MVIAPVVTIVLSWPLIKFVAFAAAGRREEALEAYRKVLALPSPEFLKEEVNQSIKKLKGRGWLGWFR